MDAATIAETSPPAPGVRERLLDAALELFYAEGIHAVGVDRIVGRAGVAKMSLYKHFKSKDDLVIAFLRRRHDLWFGWFTAAVEKSGTDPRARLRAAFGFLGTWAAQPTFRGCAFINTTTEFADPAHPARRICAAHKEELRQFFEDLANQAKLKNVGPLSAALVMLFDGAVFWCELEKHTGPARDALLAAEALIDASTP